MSMAILIRDSKDPPYYNRQIEELIKTVTVIIRIEFWTVVPQYTVESNKTNRLILMQLILFHRTFHSLIYKYSKETVL